MASIALNTSATGMNALNTQLDVIANNIANADTTGFKGSRANFQDLYYVEKKQPGVENRNTGSRSPVGLYVGLGVEVSGTQLDFQQGARIPTNRAYDIAILGEGFLQVQVGDQSASGMGYTRIGSLAVNENGDLVLANNVGYYLEPNINIPQNASNVTIGTDGTVLYSVGGQQVEGGQIELALFQNPQGLKQAGQGLYYETLASGNPVLEQPGVGGAGEIAQGELEGSNVEAVTQLVDLIRTQRAFEMNSQTFDAADETLQTIVNLGR